MIYTLQIVLKMKEGKTAINAVVKFTGLSKYLYNKIW